MTDGVCRCGWQVGELVGRLSAAQRFFDGAADMKETGERRGTLLELAQSSAKAAGDFVPTVERDCGIDLSRVMTNIRAPTRTAADASANIGEARRSLAFTLDACQARKR